MCLPTALQVEKLQRRSLDEHVESLGAVLSGPRFLVERKTMPDKTTRRKPKNPLQPLVRDENGTVRFKANKIVRMLLDTGSLDLNDLAHMDFNVDDREQFAQLIGYSLSGFAELSYGTDKTYEAAAKQQIHIGHK
jgi:hypothetical protein